MRCNAGDVVHDRFRIVALLGEGAHGEVYRAVDLKDGGDVAVKLLHADIDDADSGFRLRLIREAHAMGKLEGTCAVKIRALDQTSDGTLYLAMEYLEGVDFAAYLRRHEKEVGPLGVVDMLNLLGPVANALDAAHKLGIIHRDVKPKNIFVCDDPSRGRVRLLDFGLARDLSVAAMTATNIVAGSPATMAPEVWMGKKDRDHRVDVYALGATTYRVLAGHYPFDPKQDMLELLVQVTSGARPSLFAVRPDLPPEIDGWVTRSLTIDPRYRYSSVREQWQDLWTLIGQAAMRDSFRSGPASQKR